MSGLQYYINIKIDNKLKHLGPFSKYERKKRVKSIKEKMSFAEITDEKGNTL